MPKPQYQIQAELMLKPTKVTEEKITIEEDTINEDDYMFLGDEKHMAYCHKLYGDFNEKGLLSLQDKYDTYHIKHASELAGELRYHASQLDENLELMKQASRELIDGDSPFCNNYKIDEHGDIGHFASELYHAASSIEDLVSEISKRLAPLGRLLPIEPDYDDNIEFYKEIDDWLDDPKGYKHGIHSYYD